MLKNPNAAFAAQSIIHATKAKPLEETPKDFDPFTAMEQFETSCRAENKLTPEMEDDRRTAAALDKANEHSQAIQVK